MTAQLRSWAHALGGEVTGCNSVRAPGAQAKILNFKPFEKNTLRGFFDIELASGLILRGCTLHENGRRWVGLPAKPYTANDGGQAWAAIVDFRDKQTAARFQEMATAAAVAAFERVRGAA